MHGPNTEKGIGTHLSLFCECMQKRVCIIEKADTKTVNARDKRDHGSKKFSGFGAVSEGPSDSWKGNSAGCVERNSITQKPVRSSKDGQLSDGDLRF